MSAVAIAQGEALLQRRKDERAMEEDLGENARRHQLVWHGSSQLTEQLSALRLRT